MKLLLDENLSAYAALLLRERGFDVVHTRDVGLSSTADSAILEWCRAESRVAFTLDADFHALLAHSEASEPSVVRIRIEKLGDAEACGVG